MADAYIVGAVRTATGKKKGRLSAVHPVDLGAIVVPGSISVGSAMQAFDDNGGLLDEGTKKRINTLIDTLVQEADF